MTTLRFLHLSDWHQGRPDFDRKIVRDALVKDLADQGPLDFVIFSGDLAWSGKPDEFNAAQTEFLNPVLKAVGLKPDRLFLVPGNHDLDRDELEFVPTGLTKPLLEEKVVQTWQTDERRLTHALTPLSAFTGFVQRFNTQPSPSYASVRTITKDDRTVTLVGLNTAWMCGRHRDAAGTVVDRGQLVIGEPQAVQAYEQAPASDLHITVLHHAFDWLAPFDRDRVEGRIRAWSDLVLWGHEHEPNARQEKTPQGSCIILPAGAAFDRRVAAHPRWTNAYSVVTVDLNRRKGTLQVRQWSDVSGRWNNNLDIGPDGIFAFDLPKQPANKAPASRRNKQSRIDAADRRYRELLLEACDIVDLANLPEQDRHLATRTLDLRRLYVPLRVHVEPIADPADLEEAMVRVERRRAAALSLDAGIAEPGERIKEKALTPVGERLQQARRLIVLGDPGGGKTTLTRWIATAYLLRLKKDPAWADLPDVTTLPTEDWLPILIRCRDLDETARAGSLRDILHHTLRKAELGEAEAKDVHDFLLDRIKANRALLILDGLDEIASATGRTAFCERIEKIAQAYPDLPIIATSRIVGYRELGRRLGQRFEHLTLAPFGRAEKDAFVQRWCEFAELPQRRTQAAAELIADIHSGDRIERLTGNPMLLTTMALVKRKVGKLPHRRALLYWEAVQVMLNWRSEVDEALNVDEALPQLSYLAYAMCEAGMQRLREDEILNHLEAMRTRYPNLHAVHAHTPAAFLHLLESRTALMMESGREIHLGRPVPVWEFRHLTFQEYLAARALVDGIHPDHDPGRRLPRLIGELAGRVGEDTKQGEQWREAIRLCLSICKNDDVDPALRAILLGPDGTLAKARRSRAILAALCLADEPNATQDCATEVIKAFVSVIEERDEGGRSQSPWAQTNRLLSDGFWNSSLTKTLTAEFFRNDFQSRGLPGGVLGEVGFRRFLTEKFEEDAIVGTLVAKLGDTDDGVTAAGALAAMYGAFAKELKSRPDLIAALFACLDRPPSLAHAATWALGWLAKHADWQPTPAELARLTDIVCDPTRDGEQVRWAFVVIKEAGGFGPDTAADNRLVDAIRHWADKGHVLLRRVIAEVLHPQFPWSRAILMDLVRDGDRVVNEAAFESLARELDPPLAKVAERLSDVAWDGMLTVSPARIAQIARFEKIPESDVRAALREIAARFELPWTIPEEEVSA